jgi:hypothetical protein
MNAEKMAQMIDISKDLSREQALVVAATLIAEAIDRQTNVQRIGIETQSRLAGMSVEMMDKLMGKMDEGESGDEWKDQY